MKGATTRSLAVRKKVSEAQERELYAKEGTQYAHALRHETEQVRAEYQLVEQR